MSLPFKRTWPNKSYANCRRSCRQWRRRKSNADPLKTVKPIWRSCRDTRCFIGLTNSAAIQKRLSSFLRKQRSSIQTSPVHLLHWDGSTANLERAASLSPKDAWVLQNLADNYYATRNFEAADKIFDRAIQAAPGSFAARAEKASLAIDWKGDLGEMERQLAQVPKGFDPDGLITYARLQLLILQRKFPDALVLLKQSPQDLYHKNKPKDLFEGAIYTYSNNKEKARPAFERARPIVEKALLESSDDASRHVTLGLILAGLGQKDAAIAEGKRAVELLPEPHEALEGPKTAVALAQIYVWTGENGQALQLLERSLSTPNGVTVPSLRLDPIWDPLRSDPRFQALIERHEGESLALL